jgi:hypothetical protein
LYRGSTLRVRPDEIVPQSGIYTITHDPAHADMPHEITVIKGCRFPTSPGCLDDRNYQPGLLRFRTRVNPVC